MSYWLAGEKYDDLLRKNSNIRRKWLEKQVKRGNFHLFIYIFYKFLYIIYFLFIFYILFWINKPLISSTSVNNNII